MFRRLHAHPEIGLEEYETAKIIREELSKIDGLVVDPPITSIPTAVIAHIQVKNPESKVLLRC